MLTNDRSLYIEHSKGFVWQRKTNKTNKNRGFPGVRASSAPSFHRSRDNNASNNASNAS